MTINVLQDNVIDHLETNPGRYDLITGFDIIEHFQKDEVLRFLDGAFGALRSGGRLILQTPNSESPLGGEKRYGDFSHEVSFTPHSLERLMRLAGFTDIKLRECNPVPYGYSLFSTVRAVLWQLIRMFLMAYNLIETGGAGSGILTRIFLASGVRPET